MIARLIKFLGSAGWILFIPAMYAGYLVWRMIVVSGSACDGLVNISTWQDVNANGIREEGEPPFDGVCVGYLYGTAHFQSIKSNTSCSQEYYTTSEDGTWGEFIPGGCGDDIYLYAAAPVGYQPTTNTIVDGYSGQFGFVQNDIRINSDFLTTEEFLQHEKNKKNSQNLLKLLWIVCTFASTVLGIMWVKVRNQESKKLESQ